MPTKFKTNYNLEEESDLIMGEANYQPSMTIPDQSMPVVEIMRRYANGQPLGGMREPIYHGEDSDIPPNWEKMDLSEQMDFKQENEERIQEMKDDLDDRKNKRGKYAPKPTPPKEEKPSGEPSEPKDTTTKTTEK